MEQAVYLGGLLNVKCIAKPEATRTLGEAKAAFKNLSKCWSHANIRCARKIELYKAIVLPKLLYNLETLWLLQADKDRLDSFHAQCLRRVLRISSSYVSRVSNKDVLARAGERPLSSTLRGRQTALYKKIAALPGDDPLRFCTLPTRHRPAQKMGAPTTQGEA